MDIKTHLFPSPPPGTPRPIKPRRQDGAPPGRLQRLLAPGPAAAQLSAAAGAREVRGSQGDLESSGGRYRWI